VVTAGLEALEAQAPQLTYLSPWHTHTGYIAAIVDTIGQAQQSLGTEQTQNAMLIYTAHSIPEPMAAQAPYARQFAETAQAATQALGRQEYRLAYQSQVTGTPVAWLQPDINDTITRLHVEGYRDIIVSPIGFLCDHVEVLYDLDVQARQTAVDHGMTYTRASTVGNHPAFVHMLSTLIIQQLKKD
jgi:ferrochelatase